MRSIRAVTRMDESKRINCRRYGGKKKFIKRSQHQLAASDRKAAITVGVIMGVFLSES